MGIYHSEWPWPWGCKSHFLEGDRWQLTCGFAVVLARRRSLARMSCEAQRGMCLVYCLSCHVLAWLSLLPNVRVGISTVWTCGCPNVHQFYICSEDLFAFLERRRLGHSSVFWSLVSSGLKLLVSHNRLVFQNGINGFIWLSCIVYFKFSHFFCFLWQGLWNRLNLEITLFCCC